MDRNQTVNLKSGNRRSPASETVNFGAAQNKTLSPNDTCQSQTAPNANPGRKLSGVQDWSGEILGEYEIGDLIGVGGHGQVFKARHRCLDTQVAIKILHGIDPEDDDAVGRFRREAMASAKLIHPNLVRATDAGISERRIFLVTDLVDGFDLNEIFNRNGVLGVPELCEIGIGCAKGLEFLTANHTVHRDIKPSNIMVDGFGVVRILDLGLARSHDHANTYTLDGQVMGTLDFMSPEQASSPRDVDFRSDMYSLGCTFYFLLTGQAPFQLPEYETMASKLLAHLEVSPAPISHFRDDVPEPVEEVIMAMLAKAPDDRPASYAEVESVLAAHAMGSCVSELFNAEPTSNPNKPLTQRTTVKLSNHADSKMSVLKSLGIVEELPKSRPSQKTKYKFSLRWLQAIAGFAVAFGAAWWVINSGTPDSVAPPTAQVQDNEPTAESAQSSPSLVKKSAKRDSPDKNTVAKKSNKSKTESKPSSKAKVSVPLPKVIRMQSSTPTQLPPPPLAHPPAASPSNRPSFQPPHGPPPKRGGPPPRR